MQIAKIHNKTNIATRTAIIYLGRLATFFYSVFCPIFHISTLLKAKILVQIFQGFVATHGPRCVLVFTTKNYFSTGIERREEYCRDQISV